MNIALNFDSEWLRKVYTQSVLDKADSLVKWKSKLLLETQSEITDELEKAPGEINDVKLERLTEKYARDEVDHDQLVTFFDGLMTDYFSTFKEKYTPNVARSTVNTSARAKASAIIGR